MENTPSKLIPALIGGAAIAVLSTVPIINMGNCLCCMWVLFGGGLAAYLYGKDLSPDHEFSAGEGATTGLLAGIFGALFGAVLGYVFMAMGSFPPSQDFFEGFLEGQDEIPIEVEEMIREFQEEGFVNPMFAGIGLVFSLVVDAIFATVGGIIGASIIRKKRQPAA